jgi:hypothetical protein
MSEFCRAKWLKKGMGPSKCFKAAFLYPRFFFIKDIIKETINIDLYPFNVSQEKKRLQGP